MCIIINIIYTYNINSMPPKRDAKKHNTKKHTTNTSRRRALSSQWAAITTNPPQQHSQIPTTNVQVEGPPTHAPPTDDGVTTPNTIPVTSIPTEAPIPGGSRAKGLIGPRRPIKGQTAKKPGKKPGKKKLTTDEIIDREINAEIKRQQQHALQEGYKFAAIGNPFNVSARPQQEPVRVLPLAEPNQHNKNNFAPNNFALNNYPPPQQNENTLEPLFSGLNNGLNNYTNGGKRRNSVKRKSKSGKRKHKSGRKTKRRK